MAQRDSSWETGPSGYSIQAGRRLWMARRRGTWGRVQALFRSRPWYDMVPDQDHQIVVDGLGEFNGLDYVAAARTQDGETVMAYMPSARTVTVDLHKVGWHGVAGHGARAGVVPLAAVV